MPDLSLIVNTENHRLNYRNSLQKEQKSPENQKYNVISIKDTVCKLCKQLEQCQKK